MFDRGLNLTVQAIRRQLAAMSRAPGQRSVPINPAEPSAATLLYLEAKWDQPAYKEYGFADDRGRERSLQMQLHLEVPSCNGGGAFAIDLVGPLAR
jgi:hypothetical protein